MEIINNNHIFGYGQISNSPQDYYLDSNGALIYNWLRGEPDAIIKADGYDIKIKLANGFCMQIQFPDGHCMSVNKQLINTASPECCVNAAEEQIRINANLNKGMNKLRAYREAAKLSRAELGEIADMHPQLITKYENGERDIRTASYANVMKLSSALQCRPEEIA